MAQTVIQQTVSQSLPPQFLDYSVSVLQDRAIPSAFD
jgi:DNA gyrase/topoisomerase IV subunit A